MTATRPSPPFVPGPDLAERLYREAVAPVLARRWPALLYAAALIGPGSDVLGFDTPQSRDHDWGPRLLLFLSEADHTALRDALDRAFLAELPDELAGYPTRYSRHDDGSRKLALDGAEHRVEIETVRGYFSRFVPSDPTGELSAVDWLCAPQQYLLMLTAGRVFCDGPGALTALRGKLRWYPHDLWLYQLAAQWRRIAQEEAFMGRCGQAGDDLGSRVVAARLVRDLMRLCFLQEQRYAPYSKWLGSAFARLDCAPAMTPALTAALAADTWVERQAHLTLAYEQVARQHNALGLTAPLETTVSPFHNRPFLIIQADAFAAALRATITDPAVLVLPPHLGGYDQFVDSTDAADHLATLRAMYAVEPDAPR